jgi:hypothetical protein
MENGRPACWKLGYQDALDTKKPVAIAANDRTGFLAMTHGMEPRKIE